MPSDGSDGICAGYATKHTGTLECILYGPGMAGSCATPNEAMMSPDDCVAVGTCADPADAASKSACGTCSDSSAVQ